MTKQVRMAGIVAGKLALVTGAGAGIGRATCNILAREGASIIAADCNLKAAEETINNLPKNTNQNHLNVEMNVDKSDSVKNALQQIFEKFQQPPTILINSAGITRDNFLLKLSESDFDQVIAVNLKGTFLVTQTFSNAIVEKGITNASIINIASIVGKYGNIGQANYTASKAGVEALTKTAAKEFGKFGIRVNCILPGFIATRMTDIVPDKVKDRFIAQIPLGRFGRPEEIGEVITFLASDKSSYVNGACIDVTGGL